MTCTTLAKARTNICEASPNTLNHLKMSNSLHRVTVYTKFATKACLSFQRKMEVIIESKRELHDTVTYNYTVPFS